jgi:hypothetical protein
MDMITVGCVLDRGCRRASQYRLATPPDLPLSQSVGGRRHVRGLGPRSEARSTRSGSIWLLGSAVDWSLDRCRSPWWLTISCRPIDLGDHHGDWEVVEESALLHRLTPARRSREASLPRRTVCVTGSQLIKIIARWMILELEFLGVIDRGGVVRRTRYVQRPRPWQCCRFRLPFGNLLAAEVTSRLL